MEVVKSLNKKIEVIDKNIKLTREETYSIETDNSVRQLKGEYEETLQKISEVGDKMKYLNKQEENI